MSVSHGARIGSSMHQVFSDVVLSKTYDTCSSIKANVTAVSSTVDSWRSDKSPVLMIN